MHLFEHLNKKAVIGFAVILALALGAFFYYLAGSGFEDESALSVTPASPLDATLGRELLAALMKLKSTKLDTSVFDDPVFTSLEDFGVDIAAQPVGRSTPDNPFAPFKSSAKTTGATLKLPVSSGTGTKPPAAKPPAVTPSTTGEGEEELGGFDLDESF